MGILAVFLGAGFQGAVFLGAVSQVVVDLYQVAENFD
jgi:hypothetical protein